MHTSGGCRLTRPGPGLEAHMSKAPPSSTALSNALRPAPYAHVEWPVASSVALSYALCPYGSVEGLYGPVVCPVVCALWAFYPLLWPCGSVPLSYALCPCRMRPVPLFYAPMGLRPCRMRYGTCRMPSVECPALWPLLWPYGPVVRVSKPHPGCDASHADLS